MDALSQICEDLHISRADYIYLHGHGNWHAAVDSAHVLFYLMIEGECAMLLDEGEQIQLQQGNLLMLSKGRPHSLCSTGEQASLMPAYPLNPQFSGHCDNPVMLGNGTALHCKLLCFQCQVDQDMARPLLTALPKVILIEQELQSHVNIWVEYVLQFLMLEAQTQKPGRDTLVNRLSEMILVECVRYHIEHLSEDSESWLMAFKDPVLFRVMNAIHSNLHYNWSVNELADIAHMSRSVFAERFSHKIGLPPLTYITHHRLRVAAYMLRQTSLNCASISEKLGFSSENSFCLAFKKHYGLTPSAYRKQASVAIGMHTPM
jgi:AraC-like DNA-binding protein